MRLICLPLLAAPLLIAAATQTSDPNRAERAGDPQSRMICKTFPVTGSLISTYRACKTKHDWDRERGNLTQRDPIGSCAGGGGDGVTSFCGFGQ